MTGTTEQMGSPIKDQTKQKRVLVGTCTGAVVKKHGEIRCLGNCEQ